MSDFKFQPIFELGEDTTEYRSLGKEGVSETEMDGRTILKVAPAVLRKLTAEAIHDISHLFRPSHLARLRAILEDPEASKNDRFVALQQLKNANISAGGVLPACQDTGTAIVIGKKGENVFTGADDEEALSAGVYDVFTGANLRYSQLAPLTLYEERNTRTNLPAQVELYATPGRRLRAALHYQGRRLRQQDVPVPADSRAPERGVPGGVPGTADQDHRHRCLSTLLPGHRRGGTSAESTLKTVKLASCRYLDGLPTTGNEYGRAFRDLDLEAKVQAISHKMGVGAQFGGKYFTHDVRVIRLPRHGASCPVGIGVSCSADRQAKAKITRDGVFLERLETDPARYLPDFHEEDDTDAVVSIDLSRPMDEIRGALSRHPVKTRLSLSGVIVVARDLAHARLKERLDAGEPLPDYFKDHVVYYAGPAKTPEGYASGSFGPTTAGRMDSYVELFQSHGGSLISLAKGNRSRQVTEACKKHGGFYLGSIGGPAAVLARDHIKRVEVLDYPELGMEAVWKIDVEDFPAFIVVDDKGNDFFSDLQ